MTIQDQNAVGAEKLVVKKPFEAPVMEKVDVRLTEVGAGLFSGVDFATYGS